MNSSIPPYVEELIATRVGLQVRATSQTDRDGDFLDIALTDAHPVHSFRVRFRPGWRSAEAVFVPGTFSAPLIAQMANATTEGRNTFKAFHAALVANRHRPQFRVNGVEVSLKAGTNWPLNWTSCDITIRTPPIVINPDDIAQMHSVIADTVIPIFGMLIALIGVTDDQPEKSPALEGTPFQSLVTRYERKRVNREACIELKGTVCVTCGFDFVAHYGPLGMGYIEVHHTTPVSSMGPDYAIDVAKELEPLCANCHAMAHREDPPVAIARLKSIVAENKRP
jgi:5-methylcytosine-specific restriction protein A